MMRTTKYRLFFWCLLVFGVLLLAACSGDSGSDNPLASAPAEGQPEANEVPLYNAWEIKEPTPLLNADGALAGWGWSRHALMQYDRSLVMENVRGRLKEWEFYCVMSPEYYMEVNLADISWAELSSVMLIDYRTGKKYENMRIGIKSDNFTLPNTPYGETISDQGGAHVAYTYAEPVRTLSFDFPWSVVMPGIKGEIKIQHRPSDERLATAMPFDFPGSFFYTNKIVAMPASGTMEVNGETFTFPADQSYAVLDWGRGVWPEEFDWTWGAAAGMVDGNLVGFNIGYGEEDRSRTSASSVIYNGVLHKMGAIDWQFDKNDAMQPWRFTSRDKRFDITLTPTYDQSNKVDLAVYKTDTFKAHGMMNGRIVLDNGKVVEVKDILGFAEFCRQKW